MDRYPSISDHGLIGDLQTAALVTTYANHLGRYSEEIGLTGEQLAELPAGVQPSFPDQRRDQPRLPA